MAKPYPPVSYYDYLKIDQLINIQNPKSKDFGNEAHDETLFIIIHQVYELWFKQILHELNSVVTAFSSNSVAEEQMLQACSRLDRVIQIQKLLLNQVDVLETMTPMDFLDFRDYLYPASGFQSHQFRLIENTLGLKSNDRLNYNKQPYENALKDEVKAQVKESESNSLFSLIEKWLERTPFFESKQFDFWAEYAKSVKKLQAAETDAINESDVINAEAKKKYLDQMTLSKRSFDSLFDPAAYKKLQDEGFWRISHKGLKAALFIFLYRDEPLMHQPFLLLTRLQDIDENFTAWRQRHAMMAYRMLGRKMGTGGSSGTKYLKAAADKHKIFTDFFNLATFFIPKSELPELPLEVKKQMHFSLN